MAERQVAFANIWFNNAEGQHQTALRGQIVDFTDGEAKRLDALGALVPVGGELQNLGDLKVLESSATPAQIDNYLVSGSPSEIVAQIGQYGPGLLEQLLVAERNGQNREAVVEPLRAALGEATVDTSHVVGLSEDLSDVQLRAYLDAATVKKVGDDAQGASLDLLDRLHTAEAGRPDPRAGVLKALDKLREDARGE